MAYELTEEEKRYIRQCSIERVFNTAIRLIERYAGADEDQQVSLEDLDDSKQLVCKLWDRERNTIFQEDVKHDS